MPDVVKRLRYFDGQFLKQEDFNDEQAYHLDRERRLTRLLHIPGIASGLGVTAAVGALQAEVAPGTAIDGLGRQIVLAESRTLSLSGHAGKTVLVVISYDEELSDPATVGAGAETRWHERPVVEAFPEAGAPPADTHLRLARLVIGADGEVQTLDTTVRAFAGAPLGKELTLEKLTLSQQGVASAQWPSLTCGEAGRADVGESLRVSQDLRVEGKASLALTTAANAGVGTATPREKLEVTGNLRLDNGRPDGARLIWASQGSPEWRARNFNNHLAFFPGEGQPEALTLAPNGNVGIGARPAASARLDVRGPNCLLQVRSSIPTLVKGQVNGGAIYFGVDNNNDPNSATAAIETSWGEGRPPNLPQMGIGITRDFSSGPRANILMDYNGNTNVRQGTQSLLFVRGGDGNVGVGTQSPGARLHVSGGNLLLDANQEVFFADNGQIRSLDNNHRILFRRSENKLELREFGEIVFSPGATQGQETAKMVIRSDGSVRLSGTLVQGAWLNPTLQNNWRNWGDPHTPVGYFQDSMGFVRLRGLVTGGTVLPSGESVILTLPEGYRPDKQHLFGVARQVGERDPATLARVDVRTSGQVVMWMSGPAPLWLSLDGLTFRAGVLFEPLPSVDTTQALTGSPTTRRRAPRRKEPAPPRGAKSKGKGRKQP